MAGVKGRSGRKTIRSEEKRLLIIEKAWEVVGEFLNDPKIDRNYKLQYAIDIVKKNIPQKVEGSGMSFHLTVVKKYGEQARTDVRADAETNKSIRLPNLA